MWRGWTRTDDVRRTVDDETEFVSLTFFDTIDAIRLFAGDEHETAVVGEEARRVLVRFDARVLHYDVAFEA